MRVSEAVDILSKVMTVASLILYQLGYLDAGSLIGIVAAITAVMASLLIHRYGSSLHRGLRKALAPRLLVAKTLKGRTIILGEGCKLCGSPARREVEEMLTSGASFSKIREAYPEVDAETILAHVQHMLAERSDETLEALARRHRVRELDMREELQRLIRRLEKLYAKLAKLDEMFFKEQSIRTQDYIHSIGERRQILTKIRETLEIIGKLRDEERAEKDLGELLRRLRS